MERIKNNIFFNLSNTMLKIIGLVCMTIDHLYLYVFANTTINVSIFRIVGRIAAPLFLFAVIQAMRYSSDKKSYIFRLYKYHICICILEIVLSYLLHSEISFNVIPEWLFTAIYIYLIDMIIKKEHIIRHIVLMLIPILVGIGSLIIGPSCSVINVFLPNIFTIQYSPFFLILGIGWYYMKKKKNQIVALIFFSVFVLICSYIVSASQYWVYPGLFNYTQAWMVLAAPFIALYNNRKGKNLKKFFYIYYPTHICIFLLLGRFVH